MVYFKVTEVTLKDSTWLFMWKRAEGGLFLGRRNEDRVIWVRYGDKNNYPDLRDVWQAIGCFMCGEVNASLL